MYLQRAILVFLAIFAVINACESEMSVEEMQKLEEMQKSSQKIYDETDAVYQGIRRILEWNDLNMTIDQLVDIRIMIIQWNSLAYSGAKDLQKYIEENIEKLSEQIHAKRILRVVSGLNSNRHQIQLTYDDMLKMSKLYTTLMKWLRGNCNAVCTIDVVLKTYILKFASGYNDELLVRNTLMEIVRLLANGHKMHKIYTDNNI